MGGPADKGGRGEVTLVTVMRDKVENRKKRQGGEWVSTEDEWMGEDGKSFYLIIRVLLDGTKADKRESSDEVDYRRRGRDC